MSETLHFFRTGLNNNGSTKKLYALAAKLDKSNYNRPNLNKLNIGPDFMTLRLLYIAPFFPPLARAASYTSIKFVRGLANLGCQIDVLSDLWPSAPKDPATLDFIPKNVRVFRDFSSRGKGVNITQSTRLKASPSSPTKKASVEWLPMGEMGFFMGHGARAAQNLAKKTPYDAIIAQASPVASLESARRVAKKTGLPLFGLLDDPWGPCDLRAGRRPWHTRLIEGWFERRFLQQASHCFLVTETTCNDYRIAFPQLPADFFSYIHCGIDAALLGDMGVGTATLNPNGPFTILFLGTFSNFVRPQHFFALLKELAKRGWTPDKIRFSPTTQLDQDSLKEAKAHGITDYIVPIPPVPHNQVAALMSQADLLALSVMTPQRIAAKTYDYLAVDRPILALSKHHPELQRLLSETGAGQLFHPEEGGKSADYVESLLTGSRPPTTHRSSVALEALEIATSAQTMLYQINKTLQNSC
ncbi:glycosyltransferase [Terasakiella pusilla]|uniref:glycosyltransferase n=1 Tax=Terasakiella pusilla TaxID=64973 RepID=UPI00048D12E3|nr:glycosyltransferase [Terasakiella pusilla]